MTTKNPLSDPAERFQIYSHLNSIWPGLGNAIPKATAAGAGWHEISQAFIKRVDGQIVTHVGVIEIPLLIKGELQKVGAIHAVSTRKEQRKKGYNRECMERALAYCDERYELCQLLTDRPILYERYGFKSYPFVTYRRSLDPIPKTKSQHAFQRIDPHSVDDLARLHDQLRDRVPVSERIASKDTGWLLIIDECLEQQGIKRISYSEALKLHIVYEVKERVLHLLDVMGPQWVDFHELLGHISEDFEAVHLYFTPDRWGEERFEKQDFDEWVYMVRGDFPLRARDFCYPRLAES